MALHHTEHRFAKPKFLRTITFERLCDPFPHLDLAGTVFVIFSNEFSGLPLSGLPASGLPGMVVDQVC